MKEQKEDSLFSVLDDAQEIIQKSIGMNIRLPKPGKRSLEISTITNGIVGASLVAYGLLSSRKWTIILGAAGIASSMVMNQEAKRVRK
ncbi:hypothetical protein IW492_09780 [Enterococcus sp. BWB1-3]|uniref:hypothetical protein n=1 Tax=unclassified Enterococcus TaxID=2608891 RepID=UPI0019209081|nr:MULTISPECIES: hypothetical protein [unclassified Enterococcus]MBL1229521.1 hypothetical protein [Enterococcus sp. BWB1-3]MCB5950788.1 hypothetical protein [Enterococcus sp. BWT-B8]MCB5955229.1 hypothetical protein [Enterococcus sp. CWB-B31]